MNLSLVGYAPSENPEIAMAVLVPWAYQGSVDHGANKKLANVFWMLTLSLKRSVTRKAATAKSLFKKWKISMK